MKGAPEGDPMLWIQPHDKLGKPIDAEFLAVAQRSWKRVLTYAEQQGLDGAVAAGVLERAVQTLSSVMGRHPQLREEIKNLDDYFFWVVAHRLKRRAAKEPPVEYVGSMDELASLPGLSGPDWVERFENELALKELSANMTAETRYILDLRAEGWSWSEIAKSLGVRRNTAQVKFLRGIENARKGLMAGLRLIRKRGGPK
jgi:DNA-directed RNA polymerase specialized sigma24 family protein